MMGCDNAAGKHVFNNLNYSLRLKQQNSHDCSGELKALMVAKTTGLQQWEIQGKIHIVTLIKIFIKSNFYSTCINSSLNNPIQ